MLSHQGHSPVLERDLRWDKSLGQKVNVPHFLMQQATWDKDRLSYCLVPGDYSVVERDLPLLRHFESIPPRMKE